MELRSSGGDTDLLWRQLEAGLDVHAADPHPPKDAVESQGTFTGHGGAEHTISTRRRLCNAIRHLLRPLVDGFHDLPKRATARQTNNLEPGRTGGQRSAGAGGGGNGRF